MFRKVVVHLSLLVLFAFVQFGLTTHELSHYASSAAGQSQKDKSSAAEQCSLCIGLSHVAHGMASTAIQVLATLPVFVLAIYVIVRTTTLQATPYLARAPPLSLS